MAEPGREEATPRALRVMRRVVIGLTLVWASVIAAVVAARISFPLELEWMEGGALHQALRIQRGLPIYGAPSLDFVPFLYPPLYPGLLAALGSALPLGYTLARAVSVVAMIATAAGLWRIAELAGKPLAHRAAAVGLFLSGYVFTFRWYDVGRADSLMIALLVWALALVLGPQRAISWRSAAVAGALAAAAFWTKQTAAPLIVASGAAALAAAPRRLLRALIIYTSTTGALVLGGLWVGERASDGWLWTYLFELHQTHAFNLERLTRKSWGMLAHAAPFLLALGVLSLGTWLKRRPRADGEALRAWGVMAAAGLGVSALGYATQWAEPNAFIPGVALGAAFLAVALPVGGRGELVALGLCACQLAFALVVEPIYQPIQDEGLRGLARSYQWQAPRRTAPSEEQRARAAALRAELEAGASGERGVLALQRPWWSVLAGGPGHVGSMNFNDIPLTPRRALQEELRQRVRAGEFSSIWLEGEPPRWLSGALRGRYREARRLRGAQRVRPLSGYMSESGMVTPYLADQVLWVPTR